MEIPPPEKWPGGNIKRLTPSILQPSQILSAFSDKQFENFVREWVYGCLNKRYSEIFYYGGAGDKGRDLVAWIDPLGTEKRRCDYYQCKHYSEKLGVSQIWVEFGKICYYSHLGDIPSPQNYFIVTSRGCSNELLDLLEDSEKIREGLLANWKKSCQTKITKKTKIILDEPLEGHIKTIDFKNFRAIDPQELIEQHGTTRYHPAVFGITTKIRPRPLVPPTDFSDSEVTYVRHLFDAFGEHLGMPITRLEDFQDKAYLHNCFNGARKGYYSAESLKEFSRDSHPDDDAFSNLLEETLHGINTVVFYPHADAFERLSKVTQLAVSLPLVDYILEPTSLDKIGFCHHLANENKVSWISSNAI